MYLHFRHMGLSICTNYAQDDLTRDSIYSSSDSNNITCTPDFLTSIRILMPDLATLPVLTRNQHSNMSIHIVLPLFLWVSCTSIPVDSVGTINCIYDCIIFFQSNATHSLHNLLAVPYLPGRYGHRCSFKRLCVLCAT